MPLLPLFLILALTTPIALLPNTHIVPKLLVPDENYKINAPSNSPFLIPLPNPKKPPNHLNLYHYFPNQFFKNILLDFNAEYVLENYFEFSIPQLEATEAYSDPDNFLFSFMGNSFLWNQYHYNNVNINDPLFSGKILHKINPIAADLALNPLSSQLNFFSQLAQEIYFLKINSGFLFNHIPYYKLFDIPNHKAAQRRSNNLPPRKRSLFAFQAFHRELLLLQNYALWIDVFLNSRIRSFPTFDHYGFQSLAQETSYRFNIIAELQNKSSLEKSWGFLLSYENRDHLFSEFYFPKSHTAQFSQFAFSSYYLYPKKLKLSGNHVIHLASKSVSPYSYHKSQNLFNVTGEALQPDFPGFSSIELAHSSKLQLPIPIPLQYPRFLQFALNSYNALIFVRPKKKSLSSSVFLQSRKLNDYQSLYFSKFSSNPFFFAFFQEQISLLFNKNNPLPHFKIDAKIGVDLKAISLRNNNLLLFAPNFNLGTDILQLSKHSLRLEIGRFNTPIDSAIALFLADDFFSAQNFLWNDANKDKIAQKNEISKTIHSTSGGAYHSISPNFKSPHFYYLHFPYNYQITPVWNFAASLHYRIFKNLPWVQYKGKLDQYGQYKIVDNKKIFFTKNGTKKFQLQNLPPNRFPNPNFFNDSPIYLGATLKTVAQHENYRFEFAFSAFLINTALIHGNGPLYNSIGVFSELQADPNAKIKGIGRSDADRSYKAKLLYSYRFPKQLVSTIVVKYRDGQPFGAWKILQHNKHLAFIRQATSGDNKFLYNGEMGFREDAIWSVDVRIAKSWSLLNGQLTLTSAIYNLLDFGLELLEFTLYHKEIQNRTPIELNVPRGFSASIYFLF